MRARRSLHVLDGGAGVVSLDRFHVTSTCSRTSRPWIEQVAVLRRGQTPRPTAPWHSASDPRQGAGVIDGPRLLHDGHGPASTSGSRSFDDRISTRRSRASGAAFCRACTTTSVRLPSVMSVRKSFFLARRCPRGSANRPGFGRRGPCQPVAAQGLHDRRRAPPTMAPTASGTAPE